MLSAAPAGVSRVLFRLRRRRSTGTGVGLRKAHDGDCVRESRIVRCRLADILPGTAVGARLIGDTLLEGRIRATVSISKYGCGRALSRRTRGCEGPASERKTGPVDMVRLRGS